MSAATMEMPSRLTTRPEQTATDDRDATSRVMAAPRGVDRIVLTGFMGSGKTSVGAELAGRLGWKFVDLDREIERRDGDGGRDIPQIFRESGEAHFRHLETAALASLLGQRQLVLALGGGAPEELGNRLLLEQTPHTAVVYLSAPYATLLERCSAQAADPRATTRPVLADLAVAEARFHLRRPHYERIASHSVDTARLDVRAAAEAVLHALHGDRKAL